MLLFADLAILVRRVQ